MNFRDFRGLGTLPGRLEADFDGGMHVNAYLFTGPFGTGKSEMASICARALNCAGAQKPCDRCPPCLRALAGAHPDLIDVGPEVGKTSIAVDRIREIIARVMIRPYEGGYHAVMIRSADSMTAQAQNALLKTLESGPGSAVFFLLAEQPGKLLSTILSRCRIVRFYPIAEDVCADVLISRGIEAGRAAMLAKAGGGSVGRALALNDDEEYWVLRDRAMMSLKNLSGPDGVSAASALLRDDKDRARDVFDIFESIGRERMAAGDGGALVGAVLRARERMASNVVWINLIEHFFLEIGR